MTTKEWNQKISEVNWEDFDTAMDTLAVLIKEKEKKRKQKFLGVYGIPRGGDVVAVALSHRLGIPKTHIYFQPDIIIADEICDDGKTLLHHTLNNPHIKKCLTVVWHWRHNSNYKPDIFADILKDNRWILYPWEKVMK